jgi:hypothetical protein
MVLHIEPGGTVNGQHSFGISRYQIRSPFGLFGSSRSGDSGNYNTLIAGGCQRQGFESLPFNVGWHRLINQMQTCGVAPVMFDPV